MYPSMIHPSIPLTANATDYSVAKSVLPHHHIHHPTHSVTHKHKPQTTMANKRRRSTVLMLMLVMMLVMVMAKAAVEFLGEEEEDEEEEDYNGDGVVVTQADYTALRAFKHALDDPRGVLRSWNESAVGGACNGGWVGIKCVRGQVISIQIPWRGLRGHIAEQVGQLTQLRKLNLHDNLLQGPVPRSLSFLNHLRGLYLFRNLLSGTIPHGLGASSKYFQSVDLSHNLLSGAIPTGLASSPNIYRINLSSNNLTGSIPSDISASPSLRFLDLSRNTLSGPLRWSITTTLNHTPSFEMLSLNLSYNRFTGLVPVSLAELKNLRELSLAHNNLSGSIPSQLSNITALQALDLSGNSLTGRIPESLGELIRLTQFNVSDNDLSGSVPSSLSRRFASGSFAGNPRLCGYSNTTHCSVALPSPSPSPQASPSAHKKRKKTLTWILIILGSIVGFLLILCSLVLLCCFCRRSSKDQTAKRGTERGAAAGAQGGGGVTEAGEVGGKLVHFDGPLVFTADDLLCATAEVMGKSSYGTMYKATLEDGNQVAVKRLRERIAKGQRDFESEANALGKIRHSNLLALRAYYWGPKDEKLLVFDFMPGGSLAAFLHARAPETPLDWITRMKIALGAARGLAYLHSHENMVHGNLTSSNILLDSDMNAKIADFGLSRLMTPAANSNVIATAGALGYRAPELTKLKKATSKTDVYSYGIVLLELLTGKAPGEPTNMDNAGGNGLDLPEWVASIVKEEWTHEVFDLELMKDATSNAADELLNTLQLAMHCVDPTPSSRPDMDEVVHQLQQIKPELAPPSPASS